MATGAGGFTFDEKYEKNSLYNGEVTAYNPNIENTSDAYVEPELEIKWLKNSNNVLFQEKKELQLEVKVYKKIIKKLLKKQ